MDAKLVRFIPPLEPSRFRIVSLPTHTPTSFFNWPYSPTGLSVYYQIPFLLFPVIDMADNKPLGHATLTVQPSPQNVAAIIEIAASEKNVSKVHFLLSAGHGWREHEGLAFLYRRIGHIELQFSNGSSQRVDMVLGKNIREWAFGNSPNLVTEIDTAQTIPAWLSHDSTKRFDLMTISIQGSPKDLRSITVVGHFEDDHPGKEFPTPSINVSAITCECKG
jgi:hypothetical protein